MPHSASPNRTKSTRALLAGALTLGATLALAAPAVAANGVTIYSLNDPGDTGGFDAQLDRRGYKQLASEAFEKLGTMDDPLNSSGNLVYRPGEIPEGLTFQSNRQGGGQGGPNPVGNAALEVRGQFVEEGPPQSQLRTPVAGSSLDILVDSAKYSALRVATFQTGTVSVFDTEGRLLDSKPLSGRDIVGFAGIIAEPGVDIGRVNITEPSDSDELIVDTTAYGDGRADPRPGGGTGDAGLLGRLGRIRYDTRRGTATIAVKVPERGRLSLARTRRIKGLSTRVSKAGTVRLTVALRDSARRRLARAAKKGRASVRVRVKVTFRSARGERDMISRRIRIVRRR